MIENDKQYQEKLHERDLLQQEIRERRAVTNAKNARLRELNKEIQKWGIRKQIERK
jgi:hypothetical protein